MGGALPDAAAAKPHLTYRRLPGGKKARRFLYGSGVFDPGLVRQLIQTHGQSWIAMNRANARRFPGVA